jgi:hypothetical protein
MSRKNPSVGNQHGNSRNSQLHMHMTEREKKHQLWAQMVKRKEEASKPEKTTKPKKAKRSLMDKWYKGNTNQNAKTITALYIVVSNKKVHWKSFKANYDIGRSTYDRYRSWYAGGSFSGDTTRINKNIIENKEKLVEDIKKSPSPTIIEIKRLYELALPNGYDKTNGTIKVRPKGSQARKVDEEMYDHMLSDEQKVELMDLANLELSEIKPVTKSDVVTGVIVGAVVGACMAAYAFMSNGAL